MLYSGTREVDRPLERLPDLSRDRSDLVLVVRVKEARLVLSQSRHQDRTLEGGQPPGDLHQQLVAVL